MAIKSAVVTATLFLAAGSLQQYHICGQSPSLSTEATQRELSRLIQSSKPDDLAKAMAMLKERYAKDDKGTEAVFKDLRNLRANMMASAPHAREMLELIELGKKAKRDKNNVGYLYGMEVIVRYQLGQEKEALETLQKGLAKDRFKNTAGEVLKFWPMVFKERVTAGRGPRIVPFFTNKF